ncbi:MAG: hypothetical protein ACR2JM_11400 [Mycobacterium sp.]
MRNSKRAAAAAALVLAAVSLGASPVAAAAGMKINASGGDGTTIDHDGTQGDLVPAVQGSTDSDGDQDAFLTASEEATPQLRAASK